LTTQEDTFVEQFADVLARTGWPRMSARIFASLMATASGALTAAALSARLGVGPSAISNGAKMLRALRLVEARRQNDRQLLYEVHPDAWMEAVASREDDLLALERILAEGARALGDPLAGGRLTETADFFAFLRKELPAVVERWRATR
jgi:DNA-binding transcriptional ArsR family regulator